MVILEAMAAGVPVAAARIGGVPISLTTGWTAVVRPPAAG